MPNKWTFTIQPIKKLLDEEISGIWIDPLAGKYSPAHVTNDINPAFDTTCHMDALDFLKTQNSNEFDGAIYDPPYSNEQFRICYRESNQKPNPQVFNAHWNSAVKGELARLIKPGGKAICCGWNTVGIGKGRGFELERILLVCHGRQHNDTIVTVERKIQANLDFAKTDMLDI